ncbi:MAG TPA: sensor N-terminal transmembrane domain-containing protein, partial [Hyphomonadaceae bacterium]|nr:sensor N-terminal transmembrane domain-containing protein [Hyphomonadaceae bacterium]
MSPPGDPAARRREKDATAKAGRAKTPPKPRPLLLSPIARLILASNLAGLLILITGALVLNEFRSSLVNARKASLSEMTQLISSFITDNATTDDPAALNIVKLSDQLKAIPLTSATRIRVHDAQGELVADTMLLKDEIELRDLPPIREPSSIERAWLDAVRLANRTFETVSAAGRQPIAEARSLEEEVAMALGGGAGFS